MTDSLRLSKADALHILNGVEAATEELGTLERDEDWFCSDSRDMLISSAQILYALLGIEKTEEEDDEV